MNATESAERGEVAGEVAGGDVELVARALSRCSLNEFGERLQERRIPFAEAALAALTAAGRLFPPVVQTRDEWHIQDGEDGDYAVGSINRDLGITQRLLDIGRQNGLWSDAARIESRTITIFADDGSPYGGATLTSAWRAVEGNE